MNEGRRPGRHQARIAVPTAIVRRIAMKATAKAS
jgi:hypothetical protein